MPDLQKRRPGRKVVRKPSPISGYTLPAGFEEHPEHRHNGAWKKEDTARGKLESILSMNRAELEKATISDDNFIGTVATVMIKLRDVAGAENIKPLEIEAIVRSFERIINQVYGKPTERIEHNIVEPRPILDLTNTKK